MSVIHNGTPVPFAVASPIRGTVPCVRKRGYPSHITTRVGNRWLDLSRTSTAVLAVPSPAISRRPYNRTTATECRQILAQSITDTKAAVPARLHALDLGHRKHGVRHQAVIEEDGVVVPPHVTEDTPR